MKKEKIDAKSMVNDYISGRNENHYVVKVYLRAIHEIEQHRWSKTIIKEMLIKVLIKSQDNDLLIEEFEHVVSENKKLKYELLELSNNNVELQESNDKLQGEINNYQDAIYDKVSDEEQLIELRRSNDTVYRLIRDRCLLFFGDEGTYSLFRNEREFVRICTNKINRLFDFLGK